MPKLSNEKKLEVIKDFLTENNIKYVENHEHKKSGALIPCYIPQHRIGIRICDDSEWFQKSRGKFYPIFIRDTDTKAKVLEKIQNTIIKSMTRHQAVLNKKANKEQNGQSNG